MHVGVLSKMSLVSSSHDSLIILKRPQNSNENILFATCTCQDPSIHAAQSHSQTYHRDLVLPYLLLHIKRHEPGRASVILSFDASYLILSLACRHVRAPRQSKCSKRHLSSVSVGLLLTDVLAPQGQAFAKTATAAPTGRSIGRSIALWRTCFTNTCPQKYLLLNSYIIVLSPLLFTSLVVYQVLLLALP